MFYAKWAVALMHLMGNPVMPTSEPSFSTLTECRTYVAKLNAGPAKLWEYVCWSSE